MDMCLALKLHLLVYMFHGYVPCSKVTLINVYVHGDVPCSKVTLLSVSVSWRCALF